MALSPATVRLNKATSINELVPRAIIDPVEIAIAQSAVNGWWPAERGMMEGVADGSTLSFGWKSNKDLQKFVPFNPAKPPIMAYDSVIKKNYLQFGYGGSGDKALSRRSLTLSWPRLIGGGSGYVNNEVVTLSNGVAIKVISPTSGVIQSTGYQLLDPGSFASQPTGPLTQVSTTGSGTGATFHPEMAAPDCGSLQLSPTPALVQNSTGIMSVIAVFRCPVVGGVAGADPGGFIFGAQLNHADLPNAVESRWWGLRLGRTDNPGVVYGHINGDSNPVTSLSTGHDYRDGQWHVAMLTMTPGAIGSCKLWIDGALVGSHTLAAFSALNLTVGSESLRVGAAGLPSQGPVGGAALDIGDLMLVPLDLNASANATLRQLILNRLLATWRLGGASA